MPAEHKTTRDLQMQARRNRILQEARRVLATEGYAALNTRDLARAAGVTPPTLYNLIGSKAAIVSTLSLEAVDLIEASLEKWEHASGLEVAEAIVLESIRLFEQDEDYFRAAFIASDTEALGDSNLYQTITQRAVDVAMSAVTAARKQRLLRGKVANEALATQMYACYRAPLRDWVYQHATLDEFRAQALMGIYLMLAADAVDTFRDVLLGRVESIGAPTTRSPRANMRGG